MEGIKELDSVEGLIELVSESLFVVLDSVVDPREVSVRGLVELDSVEGLVKLDVVEGLRELVSVKG